MTELIILAIIFLLTLVFIYVLLDKMNKNQSLIQKSLIRELTRSLKSKDIVEYVESEPNEEPLISVPQDEFVDLSQVPPDKLLKSLNN